MNENELIQKSLNGEEEAFNTLILQNQITIYRHCLSMVHDEDLAQDLMQETFLHAFQHLSSFRMQAKFSTWLWRIAHNLSLNYLKREQRFDQEFNEEIATPKFVAKEIDNELIEKIQQLLPQLSSKHRVVFEMYDLNHVPQKQIAATLGISVGTVRSRLFYARKKIKGLLQAA